MGVLDTAGNVAILSLWPSKESGSKFQMLHAAFGVGAFAAPLLVKHYFDVAHHSTSTHTSAIDALSREHVTVVSDDAGDDSSVFSAFYVVAALSVPTIVWLFALHKDYATASKNTTMDQDTQQQTIALTARQYKTTVLAASTLFFSYVGLEIGFGAFIFAYGNARGLGDSQAALLTSCYWGMFAFGRICAIFLTQFISSTWMSLSHLVACCLAALALKHDNYLHTEDSWQLWTSTAFFGLFMSSIFPSAFHSIDTLISLSGIAASSIMVGAAAGEMVIPMLFGHLYAAKGPSAFATLTFLIAIFNLALYGSIMGCLKNGVKLLKYMIVPTSDKA